MTNLENNEKCYLNKNWKSLEKHFRNTWKPNKPLLYTRTKQVLNSQKYWLQSFAAFEL